VTTTAGFIPSILPVHRPSSGYVAHKNCLGWIQRVGFNFAYRMLHHVAASIKSYAHPQKKKCQQTNKKSFSVFSRSAFVCDADASVQAVAHLRNPAHWLATQSSGSCPSALDLFGFKPRFRLRHWTEAGGLNIQS
jgi:hypothetical protein